MWNQQWSKRRLVHCFRNVKQLPFHFDCSRFKRRTKQVRFYLLYNFHLQFTNKSLGSLWFACCQEEFITSSYPTSLLRLGCTLCVWPSLGDHWGHFALFVRTYRPDHFCPNENFTFNQNYSVRLILNSMHEGSGFLAKTLGKSLFHCQK